MSKTIEFIAKAKAVHNNKYDYSKVTYVNSKTKVTIICPFHGDFYQIPSSHSKGIGCAECTRNQLGTTEYFLKAAQLKHGNTYDYSNTKYINSSKKVRIICKIHGEFKQLPTAHISGAGCKECGHEIRAKANRLSKESFLLKAKQTHKNRYDYSKVEYVNNRTKVTIICRAHGEFKQTAKNHMQGSNCPKCVGNKRKTTKEWIKSAQLKHGDKYNYSKTNFTKSSEKVTIICRVHGEFKQTANNHMRGSNCPECVGNNFLKTKESFTKAATRIHGVKYDYSNTNYQGSHKKCRIICSEHGDFWQKPNSNLNGAGCPNCVGRNKTTEDIIKEFKEIHRDKYDYSQVVYKKAHSKIIIICPKHEEFKQAAAMHLSGGGCSKCKSVSISERFSYSKNEFLLKAKEIHGNRYDYSKVNYTGAKNKITIVCTKHGEFKQAAGSHSQGQGCPKCSLSKGENKILKSLVSKGIEFKTEVVSQLLFEDNLLLSGMKKTRFDFYIPSVKLLIEYDGVQHFRPVSFGMRKDEILKTFKKSQERDTIKEDLVSYSDYNIIRIPYWEFNNIEKILEEALKGNKIIFNKYTLKNNKERYSLSHEDKEML